MLQISVIKLDLIQQIIRQLTSFFQLPSEEETQLVNMIDKALLRLEKNLSGKVNYYLNPFTRDGNVLNFNVLHSGQYLIFLYYLSNSIFNDYPESKLAGKVYYLNKIMNGVDLFYEIKLPDFFGTEHPVGSVMGRAKYGNDFFFYQGCTVGSTSNEDCSYNHPIIGENVCMYPNSAILGKCKIGNNVNIGAGAIVKNQDIPDNSTVFGQSPNIVIKTKYTKYY